MEFRGPQKSGTCYRVRWTDPDSKRVKSKSFQTRALAQAWISEQVAANGVAVVPLAPSALLAGAYDGSADWWDHLLGKLAEKMVRAGESGDADALHTWGKVASRVKELAAAQTSHRDTKKLEKLLCDLQRQYKELTEAGQSGASIKPTSPSRGAAKPVAGRSEPVH